MRRALLLFAIVLGLAAIAASVSRPRDDAGDRATSAPSAPPTAQTERTPTVSPGSADSGGARADVVFGASDGEPTRRIPVGGASTVLVEVGEPGQVEIPDLGLSAPGDPLTPARFERGVLRSPSWIVDRTQRLSVVLTVPAEGGDDDRDRTVPVRNLPSPGAKRQAVTADLRRGPDPPG